jgi:transcription-repair coupling factor (superfamily II helicase)
MSFDLLKKTLWKSIEEKSLPAQIRQGNTIHLKGLHGALKSLLISLLYERIARPFLIVLPDREEAESLVDGLIPLSGEEKVCFFPGGYEDRDSPLIINPRRAGQQMRVVRDILDGSARLVVTTSEGIIQRVPNPEKMKNQTVHLEEGKSFDLYQLVETLIRYGYTRESLVEGPGEISLRGGVLDIFPLTGEDPHRIDFFGDTIESLRIFDITTQRSLRNTESLILLPSPPAWEERTASLLDLFDSNPLLFLEDPDLCRAHAEKESKKGK